MLSMDVEDEVRDAQQDIKLLEELEKELILKAGGANIHTAKTVVFKVYDNGTGVFNQEKFNYLKPFIYGAINNGEWRDLRLAMYNIDENMKKENDEKTDSI